MEGSTEEWLATDDAAYVVDERTRVVLDKEAIKQVPHVLIGDAVVGRSRSHCFLGWHSGPHWGFHEHGTRDDRVLHHSGGQPLRDEVTLRLLGEWKALQHGWSGRPIGRWGVVPRSSVPCQVSSRAEGLAAAFDVAGMRRAGEVDLDVSHELFTTCEFPGAVRCRTVEFLDGVQFPVPRQVAGGAESLAAAFNGALVGLLSSVCLHVLV